MVKVIQPITELPPHNQLLSGLIKKHITASLLPANTPPDITMNVCGTSATLTPVFPAPGIYNNNTLIWNDGSTGPTLNVTSSGTYWWQITGPSVVTNGDFSAGDTGFTSNYTDVTTNSPNGTQLYPEAAYAIGTNPRSYHNGFYSYGDHTSGSGNMLIVNGASGAAAANVPVWSENITVAANTNYVFSVWVRSASPPSPAILQFSINGSPLGGTITPTSTGPTSGWQYFTATWNSGPSPSPTNTISLVNQNIAANGNDFAIDDIVFAPVYRQNIIVNLNPIPVLSVIGEICGVASYNLQSTIIGYDTGTYTYTFKDGSGNILSGTQITAAPIGTYSITETNKVTGCTSNSQNTTVTINPVPTLSVTSPPAQCGPYDLKNAINGYDATTYTYTYYNGATTLGSSVVSASGTYSITATNNATGCVSNPQNVTVTVNLLTNLTVADQNVNCVNNAPASSLTYDLYGAITSNKTGYTYIYEDMAGNVLGTGTNFTVTENATNTYQIIEKNATGCQSAPQTVTITYDNPFLSVTNPVTVCGAGSYDLQNAITNYDSGTYRYTYRNGTNTTTINQNVTNNGTYTIRADQGSGTCRTIATVTVTFATSPTLTVTSPPAQCGGTFDLHSAINSPDATVTYTYSSGASSVVSTSGAYTITATKNGCSATATVNVTINPIPVLTVTSPVAQCGGTYDLTQAINGWDPATYTYKDISGNVLTRPDNIAASGTYTITETNNATGCVSAPKTVTITINPIPVLAVTSPAAQCGGTYDLTQAINGWDPATYTYKDGSGNVLIRPTNITTSSTYTITETNKATGCVSAPQTVTITINAIPVLAVTSPSAQCGGSYDLTQAISGWDPATYTYKDISGNVLTRPDNITTSSTYTITETNKATGCVSAPQTVTITINPIPVLAITSPPTQCGGTYDLHSAINSPDATVTYTYSSGASSVISTSGAYTITATKNGCSTTATVNVTINPIPVLTVTSPPTQCGGTFDLHSAINGPDATVTYTYSSGASSVISTSGAYTITATKNGCSTTATVNVTINPLPVLALTGPHTACGSYDLTQTIVGGYDPTTYTYVFKDPSGSVITAANAQAVTQSGTYTITEQNKSTGCTSLPQSTTVNISPNPPKPGIL